MSLWRRYFAHELILSMKKLTFTCVWIIRNKHINGFRAIAFIWKKTATECIRTWTYGRKYTWAPFYYHGLTFIPAWVITPIIMSGMKLLNQVCEWISNFITHFTEGGRGQGRGRGRSQRQRRRQRRRQRWRQRYQESWFSCLALLCKCMMCTHDRIHYEPMVVVVCLHITLPDYHNYADLFESIELKCLLGTFCFECVAEIKSIFSIFFHAMLWDLCIQLTHVSHYDCGNTCT